MNDTDLQAYVRTALILQGFDLDAATQREVAMQFERIRAIAAPFADQPLPLSAESAEAFRP